ncbi:uncharacterized protein [Epargyreus clarus]|uniref:uncharacterized protein isoform X2 n=1 Tax=Epargyreus clarus TaxID=520877 RepID=UPI003C2C522A
MDNFDRDLDDLLNMTDTDDSSSSSNQAVFESKPLILELHELKKDEPDTEAVAQSQEAIKKKKEKRKKKKSQREANKDGTSDTSSSLSDSIPTLPDEANKEEFYDAHESYHTLPENQQASPTAALILGRVQSDIVPNVEDPKLLPQRTATSETVSGTRQPSTINKPVSNPP